MSRRSSRFGNRLVLPLLIVLGLIAWQKLDLRTGLNAGPAGNDSGAVETAFAAQHSGRWVETQGRVMRLLADDVEGSRHQRFILELDSGNTLLVAHNIDLARRIPLARGDRVVLRGRYEWNERGGVLHWTHHDPDGRMPGGWARHEGVRYR
ncbi:MAG TPA: DUF3465 domain-containing protein [Gammaproteobacteria bacterium]|nr:DUF3465 domain-containing protein [Gammaproteobacteria bacterium]